MYLSKSPQQPQASSGVNSGGIAQFMLNALCDDDRKHLLDLLAKLDDSAVSGGTSDSRDQIIGSIRNLLTKAFQKYMATKTYEDSQYGMIA